MINRESAKTPKGYIGRYGLEDWYLSLSDDTRTKVKLYAFEPGKVDKGTPDVIVLFDRKDTAQDYLGDIGERAAGHRVGDAPIDPSFAEFMLKVALEAPGDHPITRHLIYTGLIKLLYKQRNIRTDAIEQCIKYCLEDIDRIEEFIKASSLEESDFHKKMTSDGFFDDVGEFSEQCIQYSLEDNIGRIEELTKLVEESELLYEVYKKTTSNGFFDDVGEFSMPNIRSFPSFDIMRIIYEKAKDYSSAISIVEQAQIVGAYQHNYAKKLIVKLQQKVSAAQKKSNKDPAIGTTVSPMFHT